MTRYSSFPLAGCTETFLRPFTSCHTNTANVILEWPQDLHFNEYWANCHVYVLYLSISISAPPSRLPLSYCLSPCQGAIICNLPKSSIWRDTKHENGAIWCKMEAGKGLSICKRVWRKLRKVQLLVGGPGRNHQDIKVKIKVVNMHALSACLCVRTYQSAHKMVLKWPSSAETSDSQSHLTTLQEHIKNDPCRHAGQTYRSQFVMLQEYK